MQQVLQNQIHCLPKLPLYMDRSLTIYHPIYMHLPTLHGLCSSRHAAGGGRLSLQV